MKLHDLPARRLLETAIAERIRQIWPSSTSFSEDLAAAIIDRLGTLSLRAALREFLAAIDAH